MSVKSFTEGVASNWVASAVVAILIAGLGHVSGRLWSTPPVNPTTADVQAPADSTVLDRLVARLVVEEGCVAGMYQDSRGIDTFGCGFRADLGLTERESRAVLRIRADSILTHLAGAWEPFDSQPDNVKVALGDMDFELGEHGLLEFGTFLRLVAADSLSAAAADAKATPWYSEVTTRAESVLTLLEGG